MSTLVQAAEVSARALYESHKPTLFGATEWEEMPEVDDERDPMFSKKWYRLEVAPILKALQDANLLVRA